MHRCGSGFLLTLVITFVIALTGCLGKSSPNPNGGAVKTVTLSPSSNFSIDVGGTQIFSANATGANGQPVLGVSIQFMVASGNPNASAPLSVASNGSACAGWHLGSQRHPLQCRNCWDRHRHRGRRGGQQPAHVRLRSPAHRQHSDHTSRAPAAPERLFFPGSDLAIPGNRLQQQRGHHKHRRPLELVVEQCRCGHHNSLRAPKSA